jgi:hypothetical protein
MGYLIRQERDRQMQVRVGRGAEWLDAREHPSWRQRINLRNFDMTNPCRCVLGQVFGNYWDALVDHGPDPVVDADGEVHEWEVEHGFNLPQDQEDDADWDALERAWVNYLREDASWSRDGERS